MKNILNILSCQCPKCGQHNIYKYSSFHIVKFMQMYDNCPSCSYNFMPEPGFYLGSMYIAYAINSFLFLITGLSSIFYFELELPATFFILFVLSILVLPYTLRVSRVLWLMINQSSRKD